MADYRAPQAETMFALETIADLPALASLPGFEDLSPDLAEAIVSEAAKLAEGGFAPLNRIGDRHGARWSDGAVTLPEGFAQVYRDYVEAAWNGLNADPAYGGQGLPFALSVAVQEQFMAANMAFALNPMLTLGAIEALQAHASDELKSRYLPKLITGEWTGTMNLTEPQAGSDVGALRSTAVDAGDGTYRITGQKIYITWGEHDLADNIVHLVLARLPDGAPGTKGISLFLVPKFLPDGSRNDLRCVSIEHKLGIHASPTCTMSYGDNGQCVGWIVGEPHGGMRAMFTMMNHARVNVGVQGVAIADRARQDAIAYARDRVQFGPIIGHGDVRRMLMTMRALTEGARALAIANATAVDHAHKQADPEVQAAWQARADLLTPITKALATDIGIEVSSIAVQVFGGMGYVEETGVAQHYRDARIAPIYEGTNGIQAMDLYGRKLCGDQGAGMAALIAEMRDFADSAPMESQPDALKAGIDVFEAASAALRAGDRAHTGAVAVPYLRLAGHVIIAWLLGRQAAVAAHRLASGEGDPDFMAAKIATTRFFAEQLLPPALALSDGIAAGGASAMIEERLLLV